MRDLLHQLLALVDRLFQAIPLQNKGFRRAILFLAVIGLLVGIYLSISAQPAMFQNVSTGPLLLLAAVAVPLTILLNSIEFILSAKLLGRHVGLKSAAETVIIGGVANMLPLPGGVIVRVAALKAEGANAAQGGSILLFVALIWAVVSFAYAGSWLLALEAVWLGALFLMIGIAGMAFCFVLSARFLDDRIATIQMFLCKIAMVLVDAIRLFLCFLAIGVMTSFGQASVLTVAGFLGSSISIVPAGLGVREGFAALLGPIAGISAGAAFLATAMNRIVGLAVTTPIAAYLAWRSGDQGRLGAA